MHLYYVKKKLWQAEQVRLRYHLPQLPIQVAHSFYFLLCVSVGLTYNSGNDPIILRGLCDQAGLPTCTMTPCKSAAPTPPRHCTPHTRTRSSHDRGGPASEHGCYNVQRWKTKQDHSWRMSWSYGLVSWMSTEIPILVHKIISKTQLPLWPKHPSLTF
jgi:hypothetical protein